MKMQIYKERSMCTGCTACKSICPQEAIILREDSKGFLYPDIEEKKCIGCGMCQRVCHTQNIKNLNLENKAYGFVHKDEDILAHSSSGGAFTRIAEKVLECDGWICGAVYDKNNEVTHILSKEKEALERMRGSKYVQSNLENIFPKIKAILQGEDIVLFTGTPCQIIGLRHYLGKEYENLLCVDCVCSSIPSPRVYRLYLEMMKKKIGEIHSISFRNKRDGWKNYAVCFDTSTGEVYEHHKENLFLRGFMGDLYSRDCCRNCPAKERLGYWSDITIGDLWGADSMAPEINSNQGASLVLVHTKKGQAFVGGKDLIPLRYSDVLEHNPRLKYSHAINTDADVFWRILDTRGLCSAYKYIYQPSLLRKIQLKLRNRKKEGSGGI